MTCKFCNTIMHTVYSCGPDGLVKKFFRCSNCHSETKGMTFDCDAEFKPNGQKNGLSQGKKQRKNKVRNNKTKESI